MDEKSIGARMIAVIAEQADIILYARCADLRHAHAGMDGIRERDGRMITATGLYDEANDGTLIDMQNAVFNYKMVYRVIE